MSAQVDKSAPGRRAALSLSGQGKGKSQVTDEDRSTPKSDKSAELGNVKNASKSECNPTELKKPKEVPNDKQKAENSKSAKEKESEEMKADEKKKTKDIKKIEKQENGSKDLKDNSKANGHESKNEKIEKNVQQKEKKQKEEAKDGTSVATGNVNDVNDTNPENAVTAEEKEPEIKKRMKKAPDTPKKMENKAKETTANSPSKDLRLKTSMAEEDVSSPKSATKDSEKISDHEEMETLIIVDDEPGPNEGPTETSTPGKVLKPKVSPPSPFQIRIEYPGIEKTEFPKEYQSETSAASKTPWEPPKVANTYRAISGRRSLRSPRDYCFQSSYRESYRRINTELDYSCSSINATMGSEPASESSFSFFGRGKKRDRISAINDIDVSPKTPKRIKLNISSFLGRVVSPVSSLRSKLMGTKLESSTPNGKTTATPMKIEIEEGVENVSMIATEEAAFNEVAKEENIGGVSIAEVAEVTEDNKEIISTDDKADLAKGEEPDDMKKTETAIETIEHVHNRKMCSLM